jgi:hypothetical protein
MALATLDEVDGPSPRGPRGHGQLAYLQIIEALEQTACRAYSVDARRTADKRESPASLDSELFQKKNYALDRTAREAFDIPTIPPFPAPAVAGQPARGHTLPAGHDDFRRSSSPSSSEAAGRNHGSS